MTIRIGLATLACLITTLALAGAPDLQSGTPVIHLSDNLDEPDALGWCIDTKGRGFNTDLHAHSCKPGTRGPTDTQFAYDPTSALVRSVPFDTYCMAWRGAAEPVFPLGLIECDPDDERQRFDHDAQSGEIRVRGDSSLCVVVGATSTSAGPFVSRDLLVAACDDIAPRFKRWTVLD